MFADASFTKMSKSSVARTKPFRETATPPTTAKSTSLRARSTNSFSNWEKFSGAGSIMSKFIHETIEFVQTVQRVLLLAPSNCFEQRRRAA